VTKILYHCGLMAQKWRNCCRTPKTGTPAQAVASLFLWRSGHRHNDKQNHQSYCL